MAFDDVDDDLDEDVDGDLDFEIVFFTDVDDDVDFNDDFDDVYFNDVDAKRDFDDVLGRFDASTFPKSPSSSRRSFRVALTVRVSRTATTEIAQKTENITMRRPLQPKTQFMTTI